MRKKERGERENFFRGRDKGDREKESFRKEG
jgi:hypothetical protein